MIDTSRHIMMPGSEPSRAAAVQPVEQSALLIVCWGALVECVCAIARPEREAPPGIPNPL
jgi:hypothetical protein